MTVSPAVRLRTRCVTVLSSVLSHLTVACTSKTEGHSPRMLYNIEFVCDKESRSGDVGLQFLSSYRQIHMYVNIHTYIHTYKVEQFFPWVTSQTRILLAVSFPARRTAPAHAVAVPLSSPAYVTSTQKVVFAVLGNVRTKYHWPFKCILRHPWINEMD
jgi:hypothetical protein